MSHYDTLGVPRDASHDEIKQAFRRRSSEAHPDKGGSDEQQAAVNAAWAVLGDAERRAEYDRTGQDAAPGSLEQEARSVLMQLFQAALDAAAVNVLLDVSQMLEKHRQRLMQAQFEAKEKRARLVKRTGKIKARQGENLMQLLIDQQIKQIDDALPLFERGLTVNSMSAQMLNNYEEFVDTVIQYSGTATSNTGGNFFGGWPP